MIYNYTEKYIPLDFWNLLDKPKLKNTRILKDATGCGATYSLLMHKTSKQRILVMPTLKLITDKMEQFHDNDKIVGICSLYKTRWTDEEARNADVILTTPDSMVKLLEDKVNLFTYSRRTMVIDEEHAAESQSFRKSFSLLINNLPRWKGSILTISATEPAKLTPFFENFAVITLNNSTLSTKTIHYTPNIKEFWATWNSAAGDQRVLVTNDIKVICKVGIKRMNLKVGDTLINKLLIKGVSHDPKSNITVISSAATEGIDLNFKAHVFIVSDFRHEATSFNIQSIIQALGRPREGLLSGLLCVQRSEVQNTPITIDSYDDIADDVNAEIEFATSRYQDEQLTDKLAKIDFTLEGFRDDLAICNKIAWQTTLNMFKNDNIILINQYAKTRHIHFTRLKHKQQVEQMGLKVSFQQSVVNLIELPEKRLMALLADQVAGVKGHKTFGTYSTSGILATLCALISKRTKSDDLRVIIGGLSRPVRASQVLNSLILTNYCVRPAMGPLRDITSAYTVIAPKSLIVGKWEEISTKGITNNSLGHIKAKYAKMDLSGIFTHRDIEIIQVIHYLHTPTPYKQKVIDQRLRNKQGGSVGDYEELVKNAPDNKYYVEKLKQLRIDQKAINTQLRQLVGIVLNDCTNDRQKVDSTRTYSAITLSMELITQLYPYSVAEIDITSANPRFIDDMVNSYKATTIYADIMALEGCTRSEAKLAYSALLNNHRNHVKRHKTLVRWGYTAEQAGIIIKHGQVKGQLFYRMTKDEALMIQDITMKFTHKNKTRRHDSVVLFGTKKDLTAQLINLHDTRCDMKLDNVEFNTQTSILSDKLAKLKEIG